MATFILADEKKVLVRNSKHSYLRDM